MKAIINSDSELKGLTFNVISVLRSVVTLNVNGEIKTFAHNEVLIVDFQKNLQQAYNSANWNSNCISALNSLREYQKANNIKFQPEYNCPA